MISITRERDGGWIGSAMTASLRIGWDRGPVGRRRLACQIGDPMSSSASSDLDGSAATRPADGWHSGKGEALELFSGLPRRYDALSSALSFGQDPRWRRALVDSVAPEPGQRILDVATGTGMVAAELLSRAASARWWASTRARRCSRRRRQRFAIAGGSRVELIEGEAEALPFADGELRRSHVHLPAPLRRGSGGDRAGARPRRPSGRTGRFARVRRAAVGPAPGRLARVHGGRAAGARAPLLAEWRRGRELPRPEHPRLLRAPSAAADRRILAAAGLEDVGVRRMSFGGGVVMWGRKGAAGPASDPREL